MVPTNPLYEAIVGGAGFIVFASFEHRFMMHSAGYAALAMVQMFSWRKLRTAIRGVERCINAAFGCME